MDGFIKPIPPKWNGFTVHLLIMHNYGLDKKQCIVTNMHFHVPS